MAKALAGLLTAFLWLTRLPVPGLRPVPLAEAVWAFPLVGLAVGGLAGLVLAAALALGLSSLVAALLAVGAMVLATGALHEDGLADYADGCGGANRVRALEIMRDSRIGSYGVLALVLVTGLRVCAVAGMLENGPLIAAAGLIAAAALSRAGMALALRLMRPARPSGLGHDAGRPASGASLAALSLGAGLMIWPAALSPFPAKTWLVPLICCGIAQAWLGWRAHRRLGGQTGDVLGAMQQLGETAALIAFSAV
ncbi:MAG: adenosylcobinamide-GDP ribazoletransferase [Paracoccus sp. (in: a-proteobacteria)]|uniref:adenosylcobinamide-GDP ribazoletransferase n=1 Tax=Paracoccus sp. TaxID=267 RepID=UPI0039E66BAA